MLPTGISKRVVAGFTNMNNFTYLFSKDLYWRMDRRQFAVDQSAQPSYPRRVRDWWFGCEGEGEEVRVREQKIALGLTVENSANGGHLRGEWGFLFIVIGYIVQHQHSWS